MKYRLGSITEVIYSVGDLTKTHNFFCDYGGLSCINSGLTGRDVLDFWHISPKGTAEEELLQFDDHGTGRLRLIQFNDVQQEYIRSSQQPWDTGGIMDINLRVNDVAKTFDELRELGWHGLSDPLFQKMGPFELYDILMKGYDDIIIAFTHRTQPPLELKQGFKIPSHVYNSSIVVNNLPTSRDFYQDKLGFTLLNKYEVVKDSPQENMFGIPHNIIPDVRCEANIFSLDGNRDTIFQIIQFHGVEGKDHTENAIPPNRGLLMYRCEIGGLNSFYERLESVGVEIEGAITKLDIKPYGSVSCFAIRCPDGVRWEFFEKS